ncbi:MAG TPA: mechanosensitive ion channel protein MscS [Ruminococcaceae bacterium]|jgi:miniconductance mechanosensitive channel|nr:mechanosensitive ion channel protein MscS [Oscillospiraceae bacterium]
MTSLIRGWIADKGIGNETAEQISYFILALVILILCMAVNFIVKKIVLNLIARHIRRNKIKWDDLLVENGVLRRLSHIVPAVIIQFFSGSFGPYAGFVRKGVDIYITIVAVLVIDALLDTVDMIYRRKEISKSRPIKGLLQVVKIASFIIAGIVIIADLMGQSPLVMLSGIGAMTAVFSLVFKDSLLGLVAGIQLSTNDMVRIGDWIEMPKYSADGSVIDISLNTVKVQNFDKTITTIPAYALISDSFKNWRGMKSSGARRIMRAVNIDVGSISFCSDALLEKLKMSDLLREYIEKRQVEIDEYNKKRKLDPSVSVNARRLTNIGVFRVYIQNYLKQHPGIHPDMIQLVRQLPSAEYGLPIQIYVFSNQTDWVEYENIQSDIFDHILSVIDQFELRVFQNPTGNDFNCS